MAVTERYVGTAVLRKEDPELISGQALALSSERLRIALKPQQVWALEINGRR